jgi:hypothetical protein
MGTNTNNRLQLQFWRKLALSFFCAQSFKMSTNRKNLTLLLYSCYIIIASKLALIGHHITGTVVFFIICSLLILVGGRNIFPKKDQIKNVLLKLNNSYSYTGGLDLSFGQLI